MNASHQPRLMLSVSSIAGDDVLTAQRLCDMAREYGYRAGLVVNVNGPEWRLRQDAPALELILDSAARDHEILLGGLGPLYHSSGRVEKGEFFQLGRHESTLRINGACRQLSQLGIHPHVFAPSRWGASAGAMEAAHNAGFEVAADAYHVWDLVEDIAHPVRVLAFGEGFGAAKWWRRNVLRTIQRLVAKEHDVRISVSAGKASKDSVFRDLERALQILQEAGYAGTTYESFARPHGVTAAGRVGVA
ncbi:polysaccharide deacetylase family protein [uncultured Corynebacterium sp.]|uniref:polysaccharide deacetylase family protein n=1 Tax=uncultured Corynebacterium sp. TaxID=159447 RepID=UPI0025FE8852|nr:polysaccharide deacetylase family protein [uncultured Corynebacterium sp.]